MSSSGTLSSADAALASSPRCCAYLRAVVPVSASMRRTPAATPLSLSPAIEPMSPVRRTWVPPQSSTDQPMALPPAPRSSPMATTRTSSPYFSPNSARAPEAMRVVDRHQPRGHRRVLQHDVVGDVLDPLDLLRRHRLGMREIEAQPVGRDQRALLRDVVAEHLAQRLVQEMGGRMVLPDRAAARVVDLERERSADLERALLDRAGMHEQVAGLLLGVGDAEAHALAGHDARYRRPGRRTRRRTASG